MPGALQLTETLQASKNSNKWLYLHACVRSGDSVRVTTSFTSWLKTISQDGGQTMLQNGNGFSSVPLQHGTWKGPEVNSAL